MGTEAIADVVRPIVARGHDVQLHCHSEWLAYAPHGLVGGRLGRNLKDFALDDQRRILAYARDTLVAAGAPRPVAFRAGNYGANDDTLIALAELGFTHDSSHCPALAGRGDCAISLGQADLRPRFHQGVIEVPIACTRDFGGRLRHGQLTALSLRELRAALRHASEAGIPSLSLVSHSFELLSRDRRRINRLVTRRFARLCASLAEMTSVVVATYAAEPPQTEPLTSGSAVAPLGTWRSGARVIEQVVANAVYSRKLRPSA